MANRTNGSVGADNDELRRMIETSNNLTLDKQELRAKTLEFKIYEQTFKVDKALELAQESIDKNTVLAKRVEQWINNIVSTSGMLGQDRLLVHQNAAQVEALQQIFLDGNRLKSLNYEHLKKTFPALVKIGLSEN
uniref:Uncharacterized protein n=1 Tax=Anopheles melas TaxID=34690 RepID=A0A182U579_9DIPT